MKTERLNQFDILKGVGILLVDMLFQQTALYII